MRAVRIFFKWLLLGYIGTWAAAVGVFAIIVIGAPLITWETEISMIVIKTAVKVDTLKIVSGIGILMACIIGGVTLTDYLEHPYRYNQK